MRMVRSLRPSPRQASRSEQHLVWLLSWLGVEPKDLTLGRSLPLRRSVRPSMTWTWLGRTCGSHLASSSAPARRKLAGTTTNKGQLSCGQAREDVEERCRSGKVSSRPCITGYFCTTHMTHHMPLVSSKCQQQAAVRRCKECQGLKIIPGSRKPGQ